MYALWVFFVLTIGFLVVSQAFNIDSQLKGYLTMLLASTVFVGYIYSVEKKILKGSFLFQVMGFFGNRQRSMEKGKYAVICGLIFAIFSTWHTAIL